MKHRVPVRQNPALPSTVLPLPRAQSGGGRRKGFRCIEALLLLAQHELEIDLGFEKEGLCLVSKRETCLPSKCKFLMHGLQQSLGSPDTGGEGVGEKIKQEDMAVCVLCGINSLLARVTGQLGSSNKMNTVFLVPGCLLHKEPLVRERHGVTCAFHLVGQFPGQPPCTPSPRSWGGASRCMSDARSLHP